MRFLWMGVGAIVGCASAPAPLVEAPPVTVPPLVVSTPIDAHCPTGSINNLGLDCEGHVPATFGMVRVPTEQPRIAFEIDVTEVTAAAYNRCVAAKGCAPPAIEDDTEYISDEDRLKTREGCTGNKPDRAGDPINCITLADARAYCGWIGKRLPTGAEWDRAATGPTPRRFPWGDDVPTSEDICWANMIGGHVGPCAAGSHPLDTSPYGVKDMAGSLSEWVEDGIYTDEYSAKRKVQLRHFRGGNWIDHRPSSIEIAADHGGYPPGHSWYMGFRCAKSAD
jgi:formylglycine-generating enzyme required for sulfatase activity